MLLEVVDVYKGFAKGNTWLNVLKGVTLEVGGGEMLAVVGPSGSGKSTLLYLIGALERPDRGMIRFHGRDVFEFSEQEQAEFRNRHVGFVFQFYNLIPSLTARENVALVTDIASAPMRPEEALALVGLEARLDHFPAQLSGGEQQRVAIARAVVKRPEVLLCDEPTGALDFQTGKLVLQVIDRINRELGTTTAVITHNAGIAAMADRVITLRSGEIIHVQRNTSKVAPEALQW